MTLRLLVALFLSFLISGALSAQEDRVRTMIDHMANQLGVFAWLYGIETQPQQEYSLRQDGDRYIATFPTASIEMGDIRVELGPVNWTIELQDDDLSRVILRLNDAIEASESGTVLTRLSIADQNIAGLWSEKARTFLEFDADLNGLAFTGVGESGPIDVGTVQVKHTMSIDANETWSQQQEFLIAGLKATAFSVAEISSDMHTKGRDYSQALQIVEQMQNIMRNTSSDAQLPAALAEVYSKSMAISDLYDSHLSLQGVVIGDSAAPMATVDKIVFGGAAQTSADQMQLSLNFDIGGVDTLLAPMPPGLLPRHTRIAAVLEGIPADMLIRFIELGLQQDSMDAAETSAYVQQQLVGPLLGSPAVLRIADSFIAANDARADLSLEARLDQTAAMTAVGEGLLRIEGLPALVEFAGAGPTSPIAPVLAIITGLAQRSEQDGKTVDSLKFALSKEGKIMINDKDVTAMFMPQ